MSPDCGEAQVLQTEVAAVTRSHRSLAAPAGFTRLPVSAAPLTSHRHPAVWRGSAGLFCGEGREVPLQAQDKVAKPVTKAHCARRHFLFFDLKFNRQNVQTIGRVFSDLWCKWLDVQQNSRRRQQPQVQFVLKFSTQPAELQEMKKRCAPAAAPAPHVEHRRQ